MKNNLTKSFNLQKGNIEFEALEFCGKMLAASLVLGAVVNAITPPAKKHEDFGLSPDDISDTRIENLNCLITTRYLDDENQYPLHPASLRDGFRQMQDMHTGLPSTSFYNADFVPTAHLECNENGNPLPSYKCVIKKERAKDENDKTVTLIGQNCVEIPNPAP